MKFTFSILLLPQLLSSCADPSWDVDRATPPKAWTTYPITKHFGRIHASYQVHPDGGVTANVTPASFPFPFHVETGRGTREVGTYCNWVTDITFHGVTERYWGHYADMPGWRAVLTVVPRDYKPNPANNPGAGGIMYPHPIYPDKLRKGQ